MKRYILSLMVMTLSLCAWAAKSGDAIPDPGHPINPGNYRVTLTVTDAVAGSTTGSGLYAQGATATLTATPSTGYEFVSWSDGVTANPRSLTVTRDTTIGTEWRKLTYTITFRNEDGTQLESKSVAYGEIPTYTGSTPTKAETERYFYTFTGWTPTITAVTANATYTAVYSAEEKDPTVPTVPVLAQTYDVENKVVLCMYFDEAVCNDIYYVGSYNNWGKGDGDTPNFANCVKFTPVAGYEGWYAVEFPYVADGQGKPVQANSDGSFSWSNQAGDRDAWIKRGDSRSKTAYVLDGYDDEADVFYPDRGAYIYELAYWKRHIDVCVPLVTYTINLYAPNPCDGMQPAIIGDFNSWTIEEPMTPTTDGAGKLMYTFSMTAHAGYDFRFREVTRSPGNEIWHYENNSWTYFAANFTTAEQTTITFDFSDDSRYRYNLCLPENYTYLVTFLDEDGTLLSSHRQTVGTTPTYIGATPTKPGTDQYSYTFADWTPAVTPVTADVTYTATFDRTVNTYFVTFLDEDGTELDSRLVAYGEIPTYIGATPTKDATAQYTYTFNGWTPAIEAVTGAATYTATYASAPRTYTIYFDANGGLIPATGNMGVTPSGETTSLSDDRTHGTVVVKYGSPGFNMMVTDNPSRDGYVFEGWYTDANGGVQIYDCGGVPILGTYWDNNHYWMGEDDLQLYAHWKQVTNILGMQGALDGMFSVSDTKRVLFSQGNLQYFANAHASHQCADGTTQQGQWRFAQRQYEIVGEDNLKASSSYVGWIDLFAWGTSGWSGSGAKEYMPYASGGEYTDYLNDVLRGANRYADWGVYNAIINGGNTPDTWRVLTIDEWEYVCYDRPNASSLIGVGKIDTINGLIILPDNWQMPTGLTFVPGIGYYATNVYSVAQWAQMESAGAVFLPAAGLSNRTAIQKYRAGNEVGWYASSDTLNHPEGVKPTSPQMVRFAEESLALHKIDHGYHANYSVRPVHEMPSYTITFRNEDGSELESKSVAYGVTPAYTGATPTKDATAQYTYTFNGWSPNVVVAAADAIYTATYSQMVNTYTVTFLDEDGTQLESKSVAYGETPVYTGETPTKAADAYYTYTFQGWSPSITAVTANATYTAVYSAEAITPTETGNSSSTGRDFWLTYMYNFGRNDDNIHLMVYAIPNETSIICVYDADGVLLTSSPVAAGAAFTYEIPRDKAYMTTSGVKAHLGVHVTSTAETTVYLSNRYDSGSDYSYDQTPVIATSSLGKEYVIQTYYRDLTNTEFAFVATEDGTTVHVNFNHEAVNDAGTNFQKGVGYDFNLNKGEVYQFKGVNQGRSGGFHNLSGTSLYSNKPIAVFNGGIKGAVPYMGGVNGDHIVEQAIPVQSWGKRFIAMDMSAFPERDEAEGHVETATPTFYYITALYDNTEIKVNGTTWKTLNAYESSDYSGSNQITVGYNEAPKLIETSHPVIMYAYMTNGAMNSYDYDVFSEPSSSLIPDVNMGVKRAVVYCDNSIMTLHYANIVVDAAHVSTMRMNGSDISSQFQTLSQTFLGYPTQYAYARVQLAAGVNVIENADAPFVAVQYHAEVSVAISEAGATAFSLTPTKPMMFIDGNEVAHGSTFDYCNRHPGVNFNAVVDYPHTGVKWELGEGAVSTAYEASHMYGATIGESDKLHNVKLYVYRESPITHSRSTDSISVSLVVHPMYYDTLKTKVAAKHLEYIWNKSSNPAFGIAGKGELSLNPVVMGKNATNPNNRWTTAMDSKQIFDSLVYTTQAYGCDSIFYLQLEVVPDIIMPEENASVCQGELFTWAGHHNAWNHLTQDGAPITTINTATAGTFVIRDTMQSLVFPYPDSIHVLTLTVNPKPTLILHDVTSTCYPASAIDVAYTATNAVTLSYTVKRNDVVVIAATDIAINASGKFTINTTAFAPGTYTIEAKATSEHDCESEIASQTFLIYPAVDVVLDVTSTCYPASAIDVAYTATNAATLSYTVKRSDVVVIAATDIAINASGKFTINTTAFAPGTYTIEAKATSEHDCESEIASQTFSIYPAVDVVLDTTVCGSYNWDALNITESGTYTQTFTAANGCDSVVTLHVIVKQPEYTATTVETCGSYTWHGVTYTESGTYVYEYDEICDNADTLHLTLTTPDELDDYVTLCANAQPFVWHNQIISEAGIYRDTVRSEGGCDRHIYTLYVSVITPVEQEEHATMCDGGSFVWRDKIYTEAGTYRDTVRSLFGCDSVIFTLNLAATTPVELAPDTVILCANALPYVWRGHVLSEPGAYSDTVPSVIGCDSVIYTLHLTITKSVPILHRDTAILCGAEDRYEWRGQMLEHEGIYYDNILSVTGCDSVIYELRLLRMVPVYVEETDTMCGVQNYNWHGIILSETGTYTDTVRSIIGCDSVIYTLNLAVTTPDVHEEYVTICAGESYEWRNMTVSEKGTYSDTIYDAYGCASDIHVLHLTVGESYYVSIIDTACVMYVWGVNGKTYTQSGIYSETLTTANGCDSIIELHLTIFQPSPVTFDTIDACRSYIHEGIEYTETTDIIQPLINIYGCDSIVRMHINITHPDTIEHTLTACESLIWNYEQFTNSQVVHQDFGCDSVVILNLTIHHTLFDTLQLTAWDSYEWEGDIYTKSGIYTKTLSSVDGCDSIVTTLILTIQTSQIAEETQLACESFCWSWSEQTYTESGDYESTKRIDVGTWMERDSTRVLHLTISQPKYTATTVETLCFYSWHDELYSESGTYVHEYMDGVCDNADTLHLTITAPYEIEEDTTICSGEPLIWHGKELTEVGVYHDTVPSVIGCDSVIYTLHLTVFDRYEFSETYTIANTQLPFTVHGRTYTEAGTYDCVFTSVVTGCDSVYHITIDVQQPAGTDSLAVDGVISAADLDLGPGSTLLITPTGHLIVPFTVFLHRLLLDYSHGHHAQVTGIGNLHADVVELLLNLPTPKGALSKHWFAFAVPFEVSVATGIRIAGQNTPARFGYDFVIDEFDGVQRATQQRGWKRMTADAILHPGRMYMFATPKTTSWVLTAAAPSELTEQTHANISANPSTIASNHSGWNGIANTLFANATGHNNGLTLATTYNNILGVYETQKTESYVFNAAMPFFVQVTKDLLFDFDNIPLSAPRRAQYDNEVTSFSELTLTDAEAVYTDKAFITFVTDKEDDSYQIGHDLQKIAANSQYVHQLWWDAYGMQLSAYEAQLGDEPRSLPIGMYAPEDGGYTLSMTDVPANISVYLTKDGVPVWDLTASGYTLQLTAGNNNGYALYVQRVQDVTTDYRTNESDTKVQKIIMDDKLFILRDGKTFNVTGIQVR